MIIPSIDVQNGSAVQLVGGKTLAIDAGNPVPLAAKFSRVGPVAIVDLDAALGKGNNTDALKPLLDKACCRVGGGIRTVEAAIRWLDAGADKVVIGTAARPEFLQQLPKNRLIAALDAVHQAENGEQVGKVVDQGWTRQTADTVLDRIEELKDIVDGFLITFVEREGRMVGIDIPTVQRYIAAAHPARVTIAGGVATANDIATLDRLGADAQVGMALYTKQLSLAECYCAALQSDRQDGLWPTVVVDESQTALGLCYSNLESVDQSLETGEAHYWSRQRGLWRKGASSGNTQQLIRVDADCDRDALRFTVRQSGHGFCHRGSWSCFGNASGVAALEKTLLRRRQQPVAGSYSCRLLEDRDLLAAKIREEAEELIEATAKQDVIHEAADVAYFMLTKLAASNVQWSEVEQELDRRSLAVTRRSQGESSHESLSNNK